MYGMNDGPPPTILKPTSKGKVINLVESCGIDVSRWEVNKDGLPIRTAASKNPSYCYGWTFTNETTTVCCLWWEEMREDVDGVYSRLPILEYQRALRSGVRKMHTDDLAEALLAAKDARSPIHVLVVHGQRRDLSDTKGASRVHFRQKDPTLWYVTEVNNAEGWILLRRGGKMIDGLWRSASDLSNALSLDETAIAKDWHTIDAMDISQTEKDELRKARIGQGAFRRSLLARWNGKCALTGVSLAQALRASHCVPWSKSTNHDRLNPKNGLLLSASVDALFDAGLISFSDDGQLLATPAANKEMYLITTATKLRAALDEEEKAFLRRHREDEFDKARRFSPTGFYS
jgi:hypothetical protein